MEMDADPAKSASIWRGLPRHFWGVVGQAKPGATTLAYRRGCRVRKKIRRMQKISALIVKQNYGFGRVLYVGLDSTWRWRYRVGDLYHHTFWGAAIRWAASDKPLMTGNDFIRFGTPQPAYWRDEEVKSSCVSTRNWGRSSPTCWQRLASSSRRKAGEAEQAVALVPLSRDEAQPRVLEGRVRDLPPGEYAIELVIPDFADKLLAKAGPPGKPARRSGQADAGALHHETARQQGNDRSGDALAVAGRDRGQERRQSLHGRRTPANWLICSSINRCRTANGTNRNCGSGGCCSCSCWRF